MYISCSKSKLANSHALLILMLLSVNQALDGTAQKVVCHAKLKRLHDNGLQWNPDFSNSDINLN